MMLIAYQTKDNNDKKKKKKRRSKIQNEENNKFRSIPIATKKSCLNSNTIE